MTLGLTAIVEAVSSHAAATGHYDRVNGAEPANAPGAGVTAAVTLADIRPAVGRSGLVSTSVRVQLSVRLYVPLTKQEPDSVDLDLAAAIDVLMARITGDFTLGGLIAEVDVLGAYGDGGMRVEPGYVDIDGQTYRTAEIRLPAIVNDLWEQQP